MVSVGVNLPLLVVDFSSVDIGIDDVVASPLLSIDIDQWPEDVIEGSIAFIQRYKSRQDKSLPVNLFTPCGFYLFRHKIFCLMRDKFRERFIPYHNTSCFLAY